MTTQPTVTVEITDADRETAERLATELDTLGPAMSYRAIARTIAEVREAAFAAGLEERADEAHEAGYAEGYGDGKAGVEVASIVGGVQA